MFKKELADVLKQTAWFLAAIFVLPVPFFLLKIIDGSYSSILLSTLEPGLIFWALFLGASLFGRERGQKAMEYALAAPYSRLGLLVRLAGARLAVLGGLWIAAAAVLGIAEIGAAMAARPGRLVITSRLVGGLLKLMGPPLLRMILSGLPVFLISLSLALPVENFIFVCLSTIVFWFAGFGFVHYLFSRSSVLIVDPWVHFERIIPGLLYTGNRDISSTWLLIALFLVITGPFLVALLASIRFFDIRRAAHFNRRYATAFLLGLGISVLATGVIARVSASGHGNYFYLTGDLKLVRWGYPLKTVQIQSQGTSVTAQLDSRYYWVECDDGPALFMVRSDGILCRVDTISGKTTRLPRLSANILVSHRQWSYPGGLAYIDQGSGSEEIGLVVLDLQAGKSDRIALHHPLFLSGTPTLIGTDLWERHRFWICSVTKNSMRITFRIWDDGRIEEILIKGKAETKNIPRAIRGYLIFFGSEPMMVLQDTGRTYIVKKEFPRDETFSALEEGSNRIFLGTGDVPYVYGKRGAKGLARMNMATLEIEDIGPWEKGPSSWGYVFERKDRYYFVGGQRDENSLEFYDLSDGRMRLIRRFADIDIRNLGTRYGIFESGIVVSAGKGIRAYAFPDLREIKY
jgi:hypothetical protein